MNRLFLMIATLCLVLVFTAMAAGRDMEESFVNPPDTVRPEAYWDWMKDMITAEGITNDLEQFKKAGLKGALVMVVDGVDAGFSPEHNMKKPIRCLSPDWYQMWNHAANEAQRLGLQLTSQICAGWSQSAGPWITPELSQQLLKWNEQQVTGPSQFAGKSPVDAKNTFVGVIAFPVTDKAGAVEQKRIIELTGKVDSDSSLKWSVPEGQWTILWISHGSAGNKNRVAPEGGIGLECAKMNREAVKLQFYSMIGKLADELGDHTGEILKYVEADSFEATWSEWVPGFRGEFQRRRGYDPMFWIPAWRGQIVENREMSERFKYDMEKTISELHAENYYSYLAELCSRQGLGFMTEAYYGPFDTVMCAGKADVPMGEFWVSGDTIETVRWAASGGHTYDKRVIAAESFTARHSDSPWQLDPFAIKSIGDFAFCAGLNHIILHGFVHQPWDSKYKPGMTMGFWGTHFGQGQTWWPQAKAWTDYLARCQYMLQQGRFAADILLYNPATTRNSPRVGGMHESYNYDICTEEILLEKLSVKNGKLVLPNGMEYKLLVLSNTDRIDLKALEKIKVLVDKGARVVGPKPQQSPGLEKYPDCDQQIKKIADQLWADRRVRKLNAYKETLPDHVKSMLEKDKGRFWNPPKILRWTDEFKNAMSDIDLPPDFHADNRNIIWTRRIVDDRDVYFLSNQQNTAESIDCSFRVTGKSPELWHPDTGKIEKPAIWTTTKDHTTIPIKFDPAGSVFVVFSKDASSSEHIAMIKKDSEPYSDVKLAQGNNAKAFLEITTPGTYAITKSSGKVITKTVKAIAEAMEIKGAWRVKFPADLGAPAEITMNRLSSWHLNDNKGVKYFSGTATYEKNINVTDEMLSTGKIIYLDLGKVKNLAEVSINDSKSQILWKPPFRIDVTQLLKKGQNKLKIKVTNLWPNRMIGDEFEPDDCQWNNPGGFSGIKEIPDWVIEAKPRPSRKRYSFTTWKFFTQQSPLLESGLLGPVTLRSSKLIEIE